MSWRSEVLSFVKKHKIINAHAHIDRSFTLDNYKIVKDLTLREKQNRILNIHKLYYDKINLFYRYKSVFNDVIKNINNHIYQLNSFIDVSFDIQDLAIKELIRAFNEFNSKLKNLIEVKFILYYVDKLFVNKSFNCYKNIVEEYSKNEMFNGVGFLPDLDCGKNEEEKLIKFFDKTLEAFDGFKIHYHIDQENNPQSTQTNVLLKVINENFKFSKRNNYIHLVHLLSPSSYSEEDFKKHLDEMSKFKDILKIIICPLATLSNEQNRNILSPTHNSIARALDYYNRGFKISIGTDNVEDMFIPFNSFDLLNQVEVMANALRFYDINFYSEILSNEI